MQQSQQHKFIMVKPAMVDIVWPMLKDMLSKATERDTSPYKLMDVYSAVKQGRMSLAYITTEEDELVATMSLMQVQYPHAKVLFVSHIAGNNIASWWEFFQDSMLQLKEKYKFDYVEAAARLGFGRLPNTRIKPSHMVYKLC